MITNRLTFDEIYSQLSFDIRTFESSKEFKEILNKYRREVKRTKKEELVFRLRNFVSGKFQNTWYMHSKAVINQKHKNYALDISYYTFRYLERGGMIAYHVCIDAKDNQVKLFIFPQHFWERYRERFVLEDLHGFDLIHYFFENNGITRIYNNHERGDLQISAVCLDGLCLGEIYSNNNNILNLKTFISNDEMHEIQKDKFERGLKFAEFESVCLTKLNMSFQEIKALYQTMKEE